MLDPSGARWRKSSRSSATGECVEVALNLVSANWQKSTRSGNSGGQCVEIARNLPGIVAVRDSKDPAGPVLVVGPAEWADFLNRVQGDKIVH